MNAKKIVCVCDGSLEGIFCAIYRAWHIGTSRTEISIGSTDMELFAEYENVEADADIAAKVTDTILNKISYEAYEYICYAAMSDEADRGEAIYRFMILGVKVGKKVLEYMADKWVCRVVMLRKKVWHESHRYMGFLRFEQYDRSLVARFEPQNDILGMVTDYFCDRLFVENFVIIDVKRKKAAFHKANSKPVFVYVEDGYIEALRDRKDEYTDLWNTFFESIMIKERENRNLQRQNMPLIYRKYM